MRTLILLLTAFTAFGQQCPSAVGIKTTTCKYYNQGAIEQEIKVIPVITNTTANTSYTWTVPVGAMVAGSLYGPTILTSSAGVFTLTIEDVGCLTANTHTVEGCPNGTPMLGIEENELNEQPAFYYDLFGNRTEFKPGVALIEQRGTKRRKVVMQ